MKSLLCGEQIREIFSVQARCGRCILYFTNFTVSLESMAKGLVLELDHDLVQSIT
jgi:hypothetical protein